MKNIVCRLLFIVNRHRSSVIGLPSVILVSCLLFLSSCFKEKPMLPPKDQSVGQTAVIEMGPDYNDQFFYSLETNTVVAQNSRMVYDLMFDCSANNYYIWLNTAKFMAVIRTDKTDLSAVTMSDTMGKQWYYELGEFNKDSNAIGQWWKMQGTTPLSRNEVYIVNLGLDNNDQPLGFVKMQMHDMFDGTAYSITTDDFKGNVYNDYIDKNATRNYRYFTFSNFGQVVDGIEPEKDKWDICFTRYSVVFYEPYYLPYQVTGVLHNPARVSAYMDSTVNFSAMEISNFEVNRLQTRRDAIGYEWKRYELGDYTMKPWYTYFIKTDEDKYYKLRFLDFKKDGVRGYPTFEYYRL